MENISRWTKHNNLRLNESKTMEMIVFRKKDIIIPAILKNAIRVTLSSNLTFEEHLNKILSKATSSTYALGTLKSHGLTGSALHEITKATTMTQVMYAAPV